MFIVRSLRLVNFLSHEDTRVEFDRGVTAIVGPNGAGKSSIVDALYYAITGSTRIRGSGKEGLIRRGTKEALVEVVLEGDGGERVRVARWVAKSSRPAVLEVNGKVYARGASEVSRALRGILGAGLSSGDAGAVELLAVVRQGGLPRIVEMMSSPREFREFIEEVLGITAYREAAERLKEYTIRVGSVAAQPTRHWASRLERMAAEAAEAEAEALRRLSRAAEAAERAEERLSRLRREIEELRVARGRLEEAEERLSRLGEEVARLEAEERRLARELAGLEEARREAERLEAEARREERLAGLAPLVARALEVQSQLDSARARLEDLRTALRAAEELERHRGAAERLGEALRRLEEVSRAARVLSAELARARRRLEEAEEKLARLERAARSVADLIPQAEGPVEVLRRAAAEAGRLEAEARSLSERAAELTARAGEEEARAAELEEKASLLSRVDGGRCPLCGSRLPRERAAELAARLRGEAREARERAARLRREAEEARRAAREAERLAARLRSAAAVLDAVGDSVVDSVEELRAEVERLASRLADVEEEERRLRRLVEGLRRSAEAEAAARRLLREAGFDPDDPGVLARVRQEAEEAERRVKDLEARLSEILSVLLAETGADSLQAAGRRVEEAARKVERARRRLEELRSKIGEYEAVRARLESVRAVLEARRREAEEASRMVEELRRAVARLESLEEEASRAEEAARRAREEAARLRAEAENARRRASEAREAARRVRILSYIRELYEKRIPAELMRSLLRAIEEEASTFLSSFNLDYVAIKLEGASEKGVTAVVLARDGSKASLAQLSGGERTAVAIAFLLGLNKVVSSRAGFLVLDEPTAEMDEERRMALIEVIRSFAGGRGIPQLIVVTHHDDVAEAADTVCRVAKQGGVSRVTCGV